MSLILNSQTIICICVPWLFRTANKVQAAEEREQCAGSKQATQVDGCEAFSNSKTFCMCDCLSVCVCQVKVAWPFFANINFNLLAAIFLHSHSAIFSQPCAAGNAGSFVVITNIIGRLQDVFGILIDVSKLVAAIAAVYTQQMHASIQTLVLILKLFLLYETLV